MAKKVKLYKPIRIIKMPETPTSSTEIPEKFQTCQITNFTPKGGQAILEKLWECGRANTGNTEITVSLTHLNEDQKNKTKETLKRLALIAPEIEMVFE